MDVWFKQLMQFQFLSLDALHYLCSHSLAVNLVMDRKGFLFLPFHSRSIQHSWSIHTQSVEVRAVKKEYVYNAIIEFAGAEFVFLPGGHQ